MPSSPAPDTRTREAQCRAELCDWYQTRLGQRLAGVEQAALEAQLGNCFGYHLVQVGDLPGLDAGAATRIPHRLVLDHGGTPRAGLRAWPQALPLAADSVDVVVLAHTLEFSADPHGVLREADRILVPEGHLAILCFSPTSLWGLARLGRRALSRRPPVPWCGHFFTQRRLRDWLALLGFEALGAERLFFRPPLAHEKLMTLIEPVERWGDRFWPWLGAAYLLLARKRVIALTPVRPRWRPRRALVGGLVEPSRRHCARSRFDQNSDDAVGPA
jgi:SAM-dependent methyltransferase